MVWEFLMNYQSIAASNSLQPMRVEKARMAILAVSHKFLQIPFCRMENMISSILGMASA